MAQFIPAKDEMIVPWHWCRFLFPKRKRCILRWQGTEGGYRERWMTSYLIARTEQYLGGGFKNILINLWANVYIPPIHICASDYTEFSVLLPVSTVSSTENKIKVLPAENEATRWGFGVSVAVVRDAGSTFAQVSFISCCFCISLSGGQRSACVRALHWL